MGSLFNELVFVLLFRRINENLFAVLSRGFALRRPSHSHLIWIHSNLIASTTSTNSFIFYAAV